MRIINKQNIIYKLFSCFLTIVFTATLIITPQPSSAQVLSLPAPGVMVAPSTSYNPAIMAGMTIHPKNPLQFDFIISGGDDNLQDENLQTEARKLINYFLAALTVPEDEMWVNLSPYEKNRIIADGLAQTEMGRDMLAQDYLLKQFTASLMYPEEEIGATFWQRVKEKTQAKFGNIDIPTNTFNKVWIVPERASVYVYESNVFVAESHLKVMLEEDFVALKHQPSAISKGDINNMPNETKDIIRKIIIPEIEHEVNNGKNFANLRQIYNSMILATWYKQNLRKSVLGKVYLDQNKVEGINLAEKESKEKIYNQYLEAFEQGVYDYIKEDYDPVKQETTSKHYFSGGLLAVPDSAMSTNTVDPVTLNYHLQRKPTYRFTTSLQDNSSAAMFVDDTMGEYEETNLDAALKEFLEKHGMDRTELRIADPDLSERKEWTYDPAMSSRNRTHIFLGAAVLLTIILFSLMPGDTNIPSDDFVTPPTTEPAVKLEQEKEDKAYKFSAFHQMMLDRREILRHQRKSIDILDIGIGRHSRPMTDEQRKIANYNMNQMLTEITLTQLLTKYYDRAASGEFDENTFDESINIYQKDLEKLIQDQNENAGRLSGDNFDRMHNYLESRRKDFLTYFTWYLMEKNIDNHVAEVTKSTLAYEVFPGQSIEEALKERLNESSIFDRIDFDSLEHTSDEMREGLLQYEKVRQQEALEQLANPENPAMTSTNEKNSNAAMTTQAFITLKWLRDRYMLWGQGLLPAKRIRNTILQNTLNWPGPEDLPSFTIPFQGDMPVLITLTDNTFGELEPLTILAKPDPRSYDQFIAYNPQSPSNKDGNARSIMFPAFSADQKNSIYRHYMDYLRPINITRRGDQLIFSRGVTTPTNDARKLINRDLQVTIELAPELVEGTNTLELTLGNETQRIFAYHEEGKTAQLFLDSELKQSLEQPTRFSNGSEVHYRTLENGELIVSFNPSETNAHNLRVTANSDDAPDPAMSSDATTKEAILYLSLEANEGDTTNTLVNREWSALKKLLPLDPLVTMIEIFRGKERIYHKTLSDARYGNPFPLQTTDRIRVSLGIQSLNEAMTSSGVLFINDNRTTAAERIEELKQAEIDLKSKFEKLQEAEQQRIESLRTQLRDLKEEDRESRIQADDEIQQLRRRQLTISLEFKYARDRRKQLALQQPKITTQLPKTRQSSPINKIIVGIHELRSKTEYFHPQLLIHAFKTFFQTSESFRIEFLLADTSDTLDTFDIYSTDNTYLGRGIIHRNVQGQSEKIIFEAANKSILHKFNKKWKYTPIGAADLGTKREHHSVLKLFEPTQKENIYKQLGTYRYDTGKGVYEIASAAMAGEEDAAINLEFARSPELELPQNTMLQRLIFNYLYSAYYTPINPALHEGAVKLSEILTDFSDIFSYNQWLTAKINFFRKNSGDPTIRFYPLNESDVGYFLVTRKNNQLVITHIGGEEERPLVLTKKDHLNDNPLFTGLRQIFTAMAPKEAPTEDTPQEDAPNETPLNEMDPYVTGLLYPYIEATFWASTEPEYYGRASDLASPIDEQLGDFQILRWLADKMHESPTNDEGETTIMFYGGPDHRGTGFTVNLAGEDLIITSSEFPDEPEAIGKQDIEKNPEYTGLKMLYLMLKNHQSSSAAMAGEESTNKRKKLLGMRYDHPLHNKLIYLAFINLILDATITLGLRPLLENPPALFNWLPDFLLPFYIGLYYTASPKDLTDQHIQKTKPPFKLLPFLAIKPVLWLLTKLKVEGSERDKRAAFYESLYIPFLFAAAEVVGPQFLPGTMPGGTYDPKDFIPIGIAGIALLLLNRVGTWRESVNMVFNDFKKFWSKKKSDKESAAMTGRSFLEKLKVEEVKFEGEKKLKDILLNAESKRGFVVVMSGDDKVYEARFSTARESNRPIKPNNFVYIYTNEVVHHTIMRKSSASMVKNSQKITPGGIDFNPATLELTEEGGQVNFEMDNSMLEFLNPDDIQGLTPVIINVTPITNFAPLLGLDDTPSDETPVKISNIEEIHAIRPTPAATL